MFGVCMIVKDEENVIERALRSVLRTVDTWCIVDTGSTDKTKEIIQKVADELGKVGHLYDRKWVNFGHNRSEALTLAKKAKKKYGHGTRRVPKVNIISKKK
jgi:glycosyltransferase involved in cell wall biosynthesis